MSEFDIINEIAKKFPIKDKNVTKGIGDDCALIDRGEFFEIISTDMYIEEDHFSLKWSSPKQIGIKAFEASVSDIAAMGGTPKYILVSLCISPKVKESEFVSEFYDGVRERIDYWEKQVKTPNLQLKISLVGGDLTHGELICVNVTVIGELAKDKCVMRSGAKPGDLICVTGNLGGSWAGLEYLRAKGLSFLQKLESKSLKSEIDFKTFCIQKNLEPHCRLDAAMILKDYASAMIDISDGLASEVRHICKESEVGAIIYREKIPLAKEVIAMGKSLNKDPYKWALSGGEDFELCFTISESNYKNLRGSKSENGKYKIVGEILENPQELWLESDGQKLELPRGYEHF